MSKFFSIAATGFAGMDSTSGLESLSPGVNKPAVCFLSVAENVRCSFSGGIASRPGFERTAVLSSPAKVHSIRSMNIYDSTGRIEVMFGKKGTQIQQSLDGTTWYDIGVTRTTGERDFIFPAGKDMFSTNVTDSYLRIAPSTIGAALAAAATTITIRVGDIGQFAASGTVYINGTAYAYTGVNSGASTLTTVTEGGNPVATAQPINSVVTQTTTPSGAPKGSCAATLGTGAGYVVLVGGVASTNPSSISYSDIATLANPELGYAFSGGSSGTKLMPAPVQALIGGERGVLIGTSRGIHQVTSFSSGLVTTESHPFHGVPNAFCMCVMEKDIVVLTNEGRVLRYGQSDAGFSLMEDPRRPKTAFDYQIQGYVQANRDADQSLAYIFANPARRELVAAISCNGLLKEFVCQWDIGAWTTDNGKNFACRTMFKGEVFAGADDTSGEIYKDNVGNADMVQGVTVPIISRITTGKIRLSMDGMTGDFLMHNFGGLLSQDGQFKMRIIVNGTQVVNEIVEASDLISRGLMELGAGVPIGGGQIGAEGIGSGGTQLSGYPFTCPYEFGEEGEAIQFEWEVIQEGSAMELRFFKCDGETSGEILQNRL